MVANILIKQRFGSCHYLFVRTKLDYHVKQQYKYEDEMFKLVNQSSDLNMDPSRILIETTRFCMYRCVFLNSFYYFVYTRGFHHL